MNLRNPISTNLITVQYVNGEYDYIPALLFQHYLDTRPIKRFKRMSGWIDPIVDKDKLRH